MFFNSEEMPIIIRALKKERDFLQSRVDQDERVLAKYQGGDLQSLFLAHKSVIEKSLVKWQDKLEEIQGIFRRIEDGNGK